MKRQFPVFFCMVVLFAASFAFVSISSAASPEDEEKLKIAREQIAEDAAFIRQVNSDPQMTPDQKKAAIAEFLRKQNEKTK